MKSLSGHREIFYHDYFNFQTFFEKNTNSGSVPHLPICSALNGKWPGLVTAANFPVTYGSIISVHCKTGYVFEGDSKITCRGGVEYFFENEPICRESNG